MAKSFFLLKRLVVKKSMQKQNKREKRYSFNITKILLVALLAIVIGLMLIACFPYPDSYIKSICKDKHFSCEQNMSIECRCFGRCIN